MAKKIDYASMYTLRKDGRYMGYYKDSSGQRHAIYDRDPESLYRRIAEKEIPAIRTFAQVADAWETEHQEQIGFKTAEAYHAPLRRILERIGDILITDVSASDVNAILLSMASRGYAKRTVQMHRDIINMICNYAIVNGEIAVNPCAAVSMPRGLAATKRTLPNDEAIAAVKANMDAPFALFALVCLYAGLRRGEALALRYEDIDRLTKRIHISKAVEYIGNNPQLKSTKTTCGTRDVILLDVLAAQLPEQGSGYVFAREDGGLLTKTQYRKRWIKYCHTIGHGITAHQLRHGYATILYEAGIGDKTAQELLGHSDITVTRNVYTHIRQSYLDDARETLNQFVRRRS